MRKEATKKKQVQVKNKKQWFNDKKVIVGIIIVLLLLVDTVFMGYIKFTYNFIKCGQTPIIARYNLLSSDRYRTYDQPGSPVYSVSPSNKYYCSASDAKADGLLPD